MEKARESAREWIGDLLGQEGDELDRTIAEGVEYGAEADREEKLSKVTVRAKMQAGRLTPRQAQAIALREQGLSHAEIAREMGISVHTVNDHLKLGRRVLASHRHQ